METGRRGRGSQYLLGSGCSGHYANDLHGSSHFVLSCAIPRWVCVELRWVSGLERRAKASAWADPPMMAQLWICGWKWDTLSWKELIWWPLTSSRPAPYTLSLGLSPRFFILSIICIYWLVLLPKSEVRLWAIFKIVPLYLIRISDSSLQNWILWTK